MRSENARADIGCMACPHEKGIMAVLVPFPPLSSVTLTYVWSEPLGSFDITYAREEREEILRDGVGLKAYCPEEWCHDIPTV